jgi:hypothetical protein
MVTIDTLGDYYSMHYGSLSLHDGDGAGDLGYAWEVGLGTSVEWYLDLPGGGASRDTPDATWTAMEGVYGAVDGLGFHDVDGDGHEEQGFAILSGISNFPNVFGFLASDAFADGTVDESD